MTERDDWDAYWHKQVLLTATMSTCLTRHTGAIVVRDRRLMASGFNGNVPGALHCVDGGCDRCHDAYTAKSGLVAIRPGDHLDICTCVHAEVNAIAQCARYGQATAGASIYTTTKPCLDCVKLMAVAGIIKVVYAEDYPALYETPPTMMMRKFHD